jgi:hypothetical protein
MRTPAAARQSGRRQSCALVSIMGVSGRDQARGLPRPATRSGSPGALLRRGPLRTVRATRRGTRLKQAAWAISGVQGCWVLLRAGCSALAGGVNESGVVR